MATNTSNGWVVRTQEDLKGFGDSEDGNYVNKKTGEISFPPSVVDSSDYEPLGDLVKKLLRGGEVSLSGRSVAYEVDEKVDPMEAIRNFDETRSDGFDLADAADMMRLAKESAELNVSNRKKKLAEDATRLKQDEKDLKEFREREKSLLEAGETKLSSGPRPEGELK